MTNQNMNKNRFATKVVIVILIASLIPTLFTSIFFYVSSSNIIKENVRESSLQITRQAADSLSFALSTGSDMSDLIYSNERLQDIVKQDLNQELTFDERQQNNHHMVSFLNSNMYASSFVHMIYVLKDEGRSWGSGTFSEVKFNKYNLEELDWVNEAVERDGELFWQGLQYDPFSGAGENIELVLPVSRVMKDFNHLNNIAFIQVLLDGSAILDKINQIKLGKTGRFFVVDEQGRIMIDSDINKINDPIKNSTLSDHVIKWNELEFEFQEDGIDYYGVKQPISNGWTIVGVVPIHEITDQLLTIQTVVFLTSLIFGVLAIIIGNFFAKRVTDPIKILTGQMKRVGEGDFHVRTSVQTSDEIGVMSLEFNRMLEKVEQLMDQVNKEQIQKKEAELRAVKHRINPHFLFNTLSTVKWLLNFKQVERANTALSALTRLLEANMGKNGTFVTIKDEVDIIEKFIEIMQIRYEQTFALKLNIEPEIYEYLIPQMLLQPIVENAIFHGIVPTGKEGTIGIIGIRKDAGVEITVRDNGRGMEEVTLNQIRHVTLTPNTSLGIGLLHVFDSVNLYFAPNSTVEIYSDPNGTAVKLNLKPKDLRGETHV
ncbi:sensor histidine kinase [Halalkalibacter alkalisediminis]|uniref:Sensor histidine kinase n=1 Tax=Halalkalibacter alkalisediminis TaxID=935616 RepID=A0ABV6NLD3_9BACI|nr:sensor histidine kinase [Halalkalibacter alkalisediminis]